MNSSQSLNCIYKIKRIQKPMECATPPSCSTSTKVSKFIMLNSKKDFKIKSKTKGFPRNFSQNSNLCVQYSQSM